MIAVCWRRSGCSSCFRACLLLLALRLLTCCFVHSEDLQSMILSIRTFVLVSVATALVKFAWGWATVEYQRV